MPVKKSEWCLLHRKIWSLLLLLLDLLLSLLLRNQKVELKHQPKNKGKRFNRISLCAVSMRLLSISRGRRSTPQLTNGGNEKKECGGLTALVTIPLPPILAHLPLPCNFVELFHSGQGTLSHLWFLGLTKWLVLAIGMSASRSLKNTYTYPLDFYYSAFATRTCPS